MHSVVDRRLNYGWLFFAAMMSLLYTPLIVRSQDSTHVVVGGQALQRSDPRFVWLWRHLKLQIATVRRVCDLTESQDAKLDALDPQWLHELLVQNDEVLAAGRENNVVFPRVVGGMVAVQAGAVGRPTADYVKDAINIIDTELASVLSQEQKAALDQEVQSSTDFRARTLAAVVVNNIERRIFLDAERRLKLRAQIADSLGEQDLHAPLYATFTQMIPQLPRAVLAELFTDPERIQLESLRKLTMQAVPYESQMLQHETAIIFSEEDSAPSRTGREQ
ncbi:MAG: hypothetical protein Aurels2KO_33350 [Aureliella sp.]